LQNHQNLIAKPRNYLGRHLKIYLGYGIPNTISKGLLRADIGNPRKHFKNYIGYRIFKGYLNDYLEPTYRVT
jgi:hypothetical protein